MKKILISQYIKNNLNAGPKAKVDIEEILKTSFDFEIKNILLDEQVYKNKIKRLATLIKRIFLFYSINPKSFIVIQHPLTLKRRMYTRFKNKTVIIHDIEGVRSNNNEILEKELQFYRDCNYVIVHNNKMKEFLVNNGIDENKIYVLEVFDYLCNSTCKIQNKEFLKSNLRIIYTGNLDKAPFIRQLEPKKMKFLMNVYGVNNEIIKNEKIEYKGKYPPDELPEKIEGDIGLVWDGNFDESDENEGFKNYTKYNNPHKLSCYLASGVPVIVWKKSAIADFVNKYNIGYTISNIYDINNIDFTDYKLKQTNAMNIGKEIRNGEYTTKILKNILKEAEIDI